MTVNVGETTRRLDATCQRCRENPPGGRVTTQYDKSATRCAEVQSRIHAGYSQRACTDRLRLPGGRPSDGVTMAAKALTLDVCVRKHAVKPSGHPPRGPAEERHEGGHEGHAHDERIEQ